MLIKRAFLLLGLAACDPGTLRPTSDDCEAVLARLVLLEADTTPVMCKYHPGCSGEDDDKFLEVCPKVISRREQVCYLRATSLAEADACLDRETFAKRIETGVVEETAARHASGRWDDGLYMDFSPEARALAELRQIRDEACACGDPTCADRVSDKLRMLAERWERTGEDPSPSVEREGQRVYAAYERCVEKAREPDITPLPPPTPPAPYP